MSSSDYQFQTDQPLFPLALYNRPLSRLARNSGRLVTIGGHASGFSSAASWPALAMAAGLGECVLMLPDRLQKLVGFVPQIRYVPSTPSGSIAQAATALITEALSDADGLALGFDVSANSDTTITLENLVAGLSCPVALFGDGLTALRHQPLKLARNEHNLLILNQTEATRLAGRLGIGLSTQSGSLPHKLELLHQLRSQLPISIALTGPQLIVATRTGTTVTPIAEAISGETVLQTAVLSTWWIQHQADSLSGLTTAAYILRKTGTLLPAAGATQAQLISTVNQSLKNLDDTQW